MISTKLRSNFIEITLIEITLQHGCSPVNLQHIFRSPFRKNTSGWLLLLILKLLSSLVPTIVLSFGYCLVIVEAVVQRCSVKKVFLEISQNSHENTCTRVSFFKKIILAQVFSCKFYEISKNTFFYRTSLVAASVIASMKRLIP